MSIWDEIAKGASDAASFAAKKTGELTATAKLKLALQSEKNNLNECYTDIGRLYYAYQRHGKDKVAEIASRISDADACHEKISAIKAELAQLQDSRVCPSCSARIDKSFDFCPSCGAKQTKTEETDEK